MSIKQFLDQNSVNNVSLKLYCNEVNADSTNINNVSTDDIKCDNLDSTTIGAGTIVSNNITSNLLLSANSINASDIISNDVTCNTLLSASTKFNGDVLFLSGNLDMADNDIINKKKSNAEYFFLDNALVTDITVLGQYVPINTTAFTSGIINNFTNSAGRLTYNGVPTKIFRCATDMCVYLSAAGVDQGKIAIFKNGFIISSSEMCSWLYDITSGQQPISTTCLVSMSTNDFLEVRITNMTSIARDIVVQYFHLNVSET